MHENYTYLLIPFTEFWDSCKLVTAMNTKTTYHIDWWLRGQTCYYIHDFQLTSYSFWSLLPSFVFLVILFSISDKIYIILKENASKFFCRCAIFRDLMNCKILTEFLIIWYFNVLGNSHSSIIFHVSAETFADILQIFDNILNDAGMEFMTSEDTEGHYLKLLFRTTFNYFFLHYL